MSLGLGVLLSTILLIAAWQAEKRQAWRKFGGIALLLIGLVVVAVVATYGYGVWAERRETHKREAEVAKVRSASKLTYWGLTLGMKKAEVRYLKGEPLEIEAPQQTHTEQKWIYRVGESEFTTFYDLYWSGEDDTLKTIVCLAGEGANKAECPSFAGLGPGSSETDLRQTLGPPEKDELHSENGSDVTKVLTYGSGTDRLVFALTRASVRWVALNRSKPKVPVGNSDPGKSAAP